MYRPRIEAPGGFYHVGTRGNNQDAVFLTETDRLAFLALLGRTARRYGWTVYAYCLMTNHYHLVLQLLEGGLSRGMCELNGGYALQFNQSHGRSNHVFGRRFWDCLIETEAHLLETVRYVVNNPVRAELVDDAAAWRWSSYRATMGLEHAPPFLAAGGLLELFDARPDVARAAYAEHVAEGRVRRQPPYADRNEAAA